MYTLDLSFAYYKRSRIKPVFTSLKFHPTLQWSRISVTKRLGCSSREEKKKKAQVAKWMRCLFTQNKKKNMMRNKKLGCPEKTNDSTQAFFRWLLSHHHPRTENTKSLASLGGQSFIYAIAPPSGPTTHRLKSINFDINNIITK